MQFTVYWELFSPLLKLCYCDANYPAMDKIYYLAHSANDAILNLAMDFDDVDFLFGPMQVTEMTGIELEMTKFLGKRQSLRGIIINIFILI